MSAGVDQRGKGQPNQVSNGPPKEPMKEQWDASYLSQPPQGAYSSAPMASPNVSEPYMANYYASMSFPYMGQGLNDAAWSNGGDPMSFLGGYGQMNNEYMNSSGMFGGFGYQPGFGWEFSGGDYSAWGPSGTQQQARKPDERTMYPEQAYYGISHEAAYGGMMNGEPERADMKGIEQGFKGMGLVDKQGMEAHVPVHDMGPSGDGGMGPMAPPPSSAPPKKTWASIASQPAKPQVLKAKTIPRAPVLPSKHNMDIGTWDSRNGGKSGGGGGGQQPRQAWAAPRGRSAGGAQYSVPSNQQASNGTSNQVATNSSMNLPAHPVLEKLRSANQYNPREFNLSPKGARYFIIKSYAEDDIHRSIKYSIWCSTEHGNKRLDAAYREREGKGPLFLFFSVNGSGHFCGMAQMMSPLDYNASSSVWAQDKWKGQFEVKWIYVKDVPNSQLRHIKLENNENKPVTNSRDTQEVPPEKGKMVLKIIHNYRNTTSIFDDFIHYEKRQEEDVKQPEDDYQDSPPPQGRSQQSKKPERQDRGERPDRSERSDRSDRGSRRQNNGN